MIDTGEVAAVSASVTVHGVKFTFVEAGPDGNDWRVKILSDSQSLVSTTNNTIFFRFTTGNTEITSQEIIDLWNNGASQSLKDMIELALVSAETDTLSDLNAAAAVAFTGGVDAVAYTGADLITTGDTVTVTGDFKSLTPITAKRKVRPMRPPMRSSPARALMRQRSLRRQAQTPT